MRSFALVAAGLAAGLALGLILTRRAPAPAPVAATPSGSTPAPRLIAVPTGDSAGELARLSAEIAALRRAIDGRSAPEPPTTSRTEPERPSPAVEQAESSGRALLDGALNARALDRHTSAQLHGLFPKMSEATREELHSRMTVAINEGRLRVELPGDDRH